MGMSVNDGIVDEPGTESAIAAAIRAFLQKRLQAKLEPLEKRLSKLGPEEASERTRLEMQRQVLVESFMPEQWIADAARRARQIQLVTHALKFMHPDAKGTSVFCSGNNTAKGHLVGTHVLGLALTPDGVCSAGALDVFKFLQIEVAGR